MWRPAYYIIEIVQGFFLSPSQRLPISISPRWWEKTRKVHRRRDQQRGKCPSSLQLVRESSQERLEARKPSLKWVSAVIFCSRNYQCSRPFRSSRQIEAWWCRRRHRSWTTAQISCLLRRTRCTSWRGWWRPLSRAQRRWGDLAWKKNNSIRNINRKKKSKEVKKESYLIWLDELQFSWSSYPLGADTADCICQIKKEEHFSKVFIFLVQPFGENKQLIIDCFQIF